MLNSYLDDRFRREHTLCSNCGSIVPVSQLDETGICPACKIDLLELQALDEEQDREMQAELDAWSDKNDKQ